MVGGVLVILFSAGLGLGMRRLHRGALADLGVRELYGLGLLTHVVMIGTIAAVTPDLPRAFWTTVVPVVLVLYPLAFLAVSMLLVYHLREGRARMEAEASQLRYRCVFENNHLPMLVIDAEDGAVLEANPAAASFYGWPRPELESMNIQQLHGSSTEDLEREIDQARSRETASFYSLHRLKNDEVREVRVTSGLIQIGEREALYAMVEDVTEMNRLEEALRKSQVEMLKRARAVEQSPVSIVITDKQGIIEYVNPFFSQATGYSQEEAIGQSTRVLNAGVQSDSFYSRMWTEISQGRVWTGEFCNRRKDGSLFWETASIAPIEGENGAILGYVAVKKDVTDRIAEMEELEGARREAESASEAKQAFLSVMSHELRTPLHQILGPCQLLMDELRDPRKKELVEVALKASEHLVSLVEKILRFSERARSSGDDWVCIHDPSRWVHRLVQPFESRAAREGFRLEVCVDKSFPSVFWANRFALEFIVGAYTENALKFGSSGAVWIRLLPGGQGPGWGRFEVENEGSPICEVDQKKLFQAFSQVDMSLSRTRGGLGLGLALCRRQAESMGATVGMETGESGPIFYCEFPLGLREDDRISEPAPSIL